MKTVNIEEIQRRHLHGLSDEQWKKCKDSFPYADMRSAMEDACNQLIEATVECAEKYNIVWKTYEDELMAKGAIRSVKNRIIK